MYKDVERVANEALGILKAELGDNYKYYTDYNGLSAVVNSDIDYTYIYIRIIPGDNIDIDISYIVLDESIQRKGHFSNIVNGFKCIENIGYILVSGVLTDEMHAASLKNGFEPYKLCNGYRLKCKNSEYSNTNLNTN